MGAVRDKSEDVLSGAKRVASDVSVEADLKCDLLVLDGYAINMENSDTEMNRVRTDTVYLNEQGCDLTPTLC